MRLLPDTHTFIWLDSNPSRLSSAALALIANPGNEVLLSVASLCEMQIKRELGKLILHLPLSEIVAHQETTNEIRVLPVSQAHVFALEGLPAHHKDPFDRILVAQAGSEDAVLVTADSFLSSYPVRVVW